MVLDNLNRWKKIAWNYGWQQVPWDKVMTAAKKGGIRQKGLLLELGICYILAYINLPMYLYFSEKEDFAGADIVLAKPQENKVLRIQLKWNNHSRADRYYTDKNIVVVHVDDDTKPADIINQFQLTRLLGHGWSKKITINHLKMIKNVIDSLNK